jgi:hypothetical protein
MSTESKQSDQVLCHSDASECMYIVAETQRNCECFEVKLSNTLCSLFYCCEQLCVFVHILDPRLSSPASIPLTYSPSLLFSSGRMFLVFLMYMTRKNWVPSLAGHAMRSGSRDSHDLQNSCEEGLSVFLSIVLFLLSTLVLPVGTQIHHILCSLPADYFINMGTTATYKGR